MPNKGKFKILSGSTLKLIAVISMLIDHIALVLGPELEFLTASLLTVGGRDITCYYIMRRIGRLAFPIFCFLITEGFAHTRNPKRYALRLLIFALLSEVPYNLMVGQTLFYTARQNIYFTLLLGLLMIWVCQQIRDVRKRSALLVVLAALAVCVKGSYGLSGSLLVLMIWLLKQYPAVQAILSYPLLSNNLAATLAFVPINMYNGERGFIKHKALQYGFYVFYPLHIVVLVAVKWLLG